MSTFTIDSDNNVTAHTGLPAGADESQSFSTQRELAKLAADWPVTRLADTWNSFAGVARTLVNYRVAPVVRVPESNRIAT
jgi:hypothetical protein